MIKKLYFRTLCSYEHMVEWQNRKFNSYHHALPGLWVQGYYKLGFREKYCFPLRFMDGIKEVEYTESAREQFLKYADEYDLGEIWQPDHLKYCSELNGICAFDNAQDAYKYASDSLARKRGVDRYVVFEGIEVCSAPEDNGYVVKLLNIVADIMTGENFENSFLSSPK